MRTSLEPDVPEDVTEDERTVPSTTLILLEPADDAAVCDADGWCA